MAPVELTGIHGFVGVSAPKRHQPEHDHSSSSSACGSVVANSAENEVLKASMFIKMIFRHMILKVMERPLEYNLQQPGSRCSFLIDNPSGKLGRIIARGHRQKGLGLVSVECTQVLASITNPFVASTAELNSHDARSLTCRLATVCLKAARHIEHFEVY